MTRIWMNHWFSTAVNIIGLLRKDDLPVYIVGTNENEYSVIRNYCDEWYTEPVLKDEAYVDYCLQFCEEHSIDVFMPRRGMLKISEHKKRFEDKGIRVLLDDFGIVNVLNHKEEAYRYYKDNGIGNVPDYYIVNNVDAFIDAYNKLLEDHPQVCFKFVKDEGGKSFRLIDNQRKGYTALFKKQNTRMTLDDAVDALSEREIFAPVMIMPFLPDEEVSVDCLNTRQGLITLPRVKSYEKYEVLQYDQDIISLCERFQEKAQLRCPYNIQFKYYNGVPYFLEVNTRMSGGIHMSCHASDVNIPQIALRELLGESVSWQNNCERKMVSQVLTPIVIE
ncbi:ATP-grasp domain-containing protein [Butyrivibrio sp. VCB2001]|uniref:ATP-grasp domain-containing protein n=1 Tax=Butyrivibrio sp. VCB2001 TaxID=1280667 RepID=UPI00047BEDA5|nr:ATP-grasp domain-containing protein [Butyrivibrio sp. VCB2001]